MSTQERRERDRATRRATIVATARDLAEQEGWDAVTTRRLAERIEYSQPVLYSHFAGKDAIVAAVAREGFGELAVGMGRATDGAADPRAALEAVALAYLAFARSGPATYAAMFTAPLDLAFAAADTPAELHEAFAALRAPVAALTGHTGPAADLRTELVWSTLHGLATLEATGRIPPDGRAARVELLVRSFDPSGAQAIVKGSP